MDRLLPIFNSEENCKSYWETVRWPNGVESPFDEYSKVYVCNKGKFRCNNTGKYFSVRTNTAFSNSRLSLLNWTEILNHAIVTDLEPKWITEEFKVSLKTAYLICSKLKHLFPLRDFGPQVTEQFTLADWLFQIKN